MALAPPASPSLALEPLPVDRSWLGAPDQGGPGGRGVGQSDKVASAGQGVRSVPDSLALWESLGSLGESPLHAKRQRRGVDGSRPP